MKRLSIVLAFSQFLLFSCGSTPDKEETKTADTTAAAPAEPASVKPVFTPFKVVVIQHKVKNYEKSVAGYFNNDSLRKTYGISNYVLARDLKDPNTVFVINKIEDVDRAKSYFTQPLVKKAMMKAGVSSAPGYTYALMVRRNDIPSESDLHVSVSHHVKDFDAWLKAFDAETDADRAANGLINRSIARNLYDSNTVSLIFAVSDSAKAKARLASPELKKIMADAGVDGTPTIRWFREVK